MKTLFVMLGSVEEDDPPDECPLCKTVSLRRRFGLWTHYCTIAGKQVFWT